MPYKVVDRRPGDTVAVWAATEYAEKELGWKSKLGLMEMCRDQWAWAQKYPKVGWDGCCERALWFCTLARLAGTNDQKRVGVQCVQ